MQHSRRTSHSDDDLYIADEFEEFHIRSYSGGNLPFDRDKLLARVREDQQKKESEEGVSPSTSSTWSIGSMRPRVYSCPVPKPMLRSKRTNRSLRREKVRSFSLSTKGLVTEDDSYRLSSGSTTSSASTSDFAKWDFILDIPNQRYCVVVAGKSSVGKTSIIASFVKEGPPTGEVS